MAKPGGQNGFIVGSVCPVAWMQCRRKWTKIGEIEVLSASSSLTLKLLICLLRCSKQHKLQTTNCSKYHSQLLAKTTRRHCPEKKKNSSRTYSKPLPIANYIVTVRYNEMSSSTPVSFITFQCSISFSSAETLIRTTRTKNFNHFSIWRWSPLTLQQLLTHALILVSTCSLGLHKLLQK